MKQKGKFTSRQKQRSQIIALSLGDGCLHIRHRRYGKRHYGSMTIQHSEKQYDFLSWKARLLSDLFERNIKTRWISTNNKYQLSVTEGRLAALRKHFYPNGKKDVTKMFYYLHNAKWAFAIWLMDCGSCETASNNKLGKSSRFRLFTCSYSLPQQEKIVEWINETWGINSTKICSQYNTKQNATWLYLKISSEDSIKIWKEIRNFVLYFDSMKYKFRFIEAYFQEINSMEENNGNNKIA